MYHFRRFLPGAGACQRLPRAVGVSKAKIAVNASQETLLAAGLRFENEAWLSCLLSDAWKGKLKDFVLK